MINTGFGEQGATVTIHLTEHGRAMGVAAQSQPAGSHRDHAGDPSGSDGIAARGGGQVMADGSRGRIATLDELATMARAMASAVDALQMSIALQLQAEHAAAAVDDFPLAVYLEAAAEGALDTEEECHCPCCGHETRRRGEICGACR